MSRLLLSAPDVGSLERQALIDAFDGGWIAPAGPDLAKFESDLGAVAGMSGVVALASGSAALHLALLVHGVRPGDDVFVSTFTFAASANVVSYCGANAVFIDSDNESWNMSPALLAEALSAAALAGRVPAAVIVVDLYGQCADYDAIVAICQEYDVPVIEDAAEALGATYRGRAAGTFGSASVLSFNGNKIITTSGGGAFLSSSPALVDRVRYLSTQARQPTLHYEHEDIGYNYRLSNLLAALGRAQLTRLASIVARRREINDRYRSLLVDSAGSPLVDFMPVPEWSQWNGWLTCIVLASTEARDRVIAALDADDIESRPLWKPMHLQPIFTDHRSVVDGTSESLFARGLCLPSGSSLSDDDIARVAERIIVSVDTASEPT